MINIKEDEKLNVLNHSCAHLLAHAVKHLYPNAMYWVGPVIENGFYYDIDLGDEVLSEEDLEKIEREMKKISKSDKLIIKESSWLVRMNIIVTCYYLFSRIMKSNSVNTVKIN